MVRPPSRAPQGSPKSAAGDRPRPPGRDDDRPRAPSRSGDRPPPKGGKPRAEGGKRDRPPTPPPPPPPGLESRRAALDILGLVANDRTLDDALGECRTFEALEGPDRGLARLIATTVLRRRGSLDHVIGAYLEKPIEARAARAMDILRCAAAQTIFLGTPDHAVVSLAVAAAQERQETAAYAGLINAVARKIVRTGAATVAKLPERVDTPGWLWRSWERAYGPVAARGIARAHRNEAPLDITPKAAGAAAALAGRLGGRLTPFGGVRLDRPGPVDELAGFREGEWWVQDAAAALPARLLGDVAGKTVLDLCAAPGGKTMQLASVGARVTSVDISGDRLKRVAENLARTGLSAETVKADVLAYRPAQPVDAVLLDAPCTATGTIRRRPDVAWGKTESDLAALVDLQARLIDRALGFLAPGGALVYCTCSLQPAEGEEQIEAALKRHPNATRVPVEAHEVGGLAAAINRAGDLRTLPSMLAEAGGLDGFFAARLRRATADEIDG